LQRDSLLDLLARFIHLQVEEKRDEQGRKVKKESMIFPRYHQLQAVRTLVEAARQEGVGHNYLIEHSAGSGKSNTIGWPIGWPHFTMPRTNGFSIALSWSRTA